MSTQWYISFRKGIKFGQNLILLTKSTLSILSLNNLILLLLNWDEWSHPCNWYSINQWLTGNGFRPKIPIDHQQGKSEGFDSCDRPSNLTQIGFESSIFQPVWPLKFNGWPRKIIGHLFYTTSSFVHHFKSISEFKLELQSGNAQFGSKSTIFLSRVTLQFDGWPWKTIGHLFYATSSFVHHFVAIGELKLELQSGNAQFGSNYTIFLVVWP